MARTKLIYDGKEIDIPGELNWLEVESNIPSIIETIEHCIAFRTAVAITEEEDSAIIAELAIANYFVHVALKQVSEAMNEEQPTPGAKGMDS